MSPTVACRFTMSFGGAASFLGQAATTGFLTVWPLIFFTLACSAGSAAPSDVAGHASGRGGGATSGSGDPGAGGGTTLNIDAGADDAGNNPTESNNCGLVPYMLDQNPAPVLLVQDRSTSMRGSVSGGGTRWTNLSAAAQQVVTQTQANVAWGLEFFPNTKACQISAGPDIVPMLGNAAPIIGALTAIAGDSTGKGLTDGTPTRKVLQDATKFLNGIKSGNKYIVLATDGQPTCLNDDTGADDTAASLDAGRAAAAAGIKIGVVGIAFEPVAPGATPDPKLQFLNDMADIGGMPRTDPNDPQTHYYPASSTAQLAAAFAAITSQVISCAFKLPKVPPVPENVAVKINGVKIPEDPSNGWQYDADMTSVILHGSACDNVKNSTGALDVNIIMGCPDQVIP